MTDEQFIAAMSERAARGMIAARAFDAAEYMAMSESNRVRLQRCMASGLGMPDSAMGCYVGEAADLDCLRLWFRRVAAIKHGGYGGSPFAPGALPPLDLADHGISACSMRIRQARNLADHAFPSLMSLEERTALEARVVDAVMTLGWEGKYLSLTPDHPNQMSHAEQRGLIEQHLLFKPLDDDAYLVAAGISGGWPAGRGVWLAADRGFALWINEEDHLRVMVMETGTDLQPLHARLSEPIAALFEALDVPPAMDDDFGVVTSCPTNFGTTMRASIHLPLPRQMRDPATARGHAAKLGLDLRGVAGEHSDAGDDGMIDISPSARLNVTDHDILRRLHAGAGHLWRLEQSDRQ